MAEGGSDRYYGIHSPSLPPPPHLDPIFPLFIQPDFLASVIQKMDSARAVYRLWPFLDMTSYLFDDDIYFRSKSTPQHIWLLHFHQYNFIMEKYEETYQAVEGWGISFLTDEWLQLTERFHCIHCYRPGWLIRHSDYGHIIIFMYFGSVLFVYHGWRRQW